MPRIKRRADGTPKYAIKRRMRRRLRGKRPGAQSRVYTFVRSCTSNNQGSNSLLLKTDGSGNYQFTNSAGTIGGTMLTMEFLLTGVNIYLTNTLVTQATMPSTNEFTTLFDTYMIDKVEVTALFSFSNATGAAGSGAFQCPYIIHAVDYDDSNATNAAALLQYPDTKWTQMLGTPQKLRTIRPKQSVMVYNTATSTAYGPKRGWLDCVNNAVPHYGFKMALDNNAQSNSTANQVFGNINFVFKYTLKLKDTI